MSHSEITVYWEHDGKNYIIARIPLREGFVNVFSLNCGVMTFQGDYGDGYACDERATVGALMKFLRWRRREILDCHPTQVRKWKSREVEYLDTKVMPVLKALAKGFRVDV